MVPPMALPPDTPSNQVLFKLVQQSLPPGLVGLAGAAGPRGRVAPGFPLRAPALLDGGGFEGLGELGHRSGVAGVGTGVT